VPDVLPGVSERPSPFVPPAHKRGDGVTVGETISILLMLGAAGAVIAFLDWIQRNLPDALGNSPRKVADDDCMTTPWGEVVTLHPEFRGVKADRHNGGGGRLKEPIDLRGTELSHCSVPVSHSGTGGK
jgi:hypothetical protein